MTGLDISNARRDCGFTQQQLATEWGVSVDWIKSIETGRREPKAWMGEYLRMRGEELAASEQSLGEAVAALQDVANRELQAREGIGGCPVEYLGDSTERMARWLDEVRTDEPGPDAWGGHRTAADVRDTQVRYLRAVIAEASMTIARVQAAE